MNTIELITLNLVSVTWVSLSYMNPNWISGGIQDVIMILIGFSIIFLNIARGIKALRKNDKE